MSEPTSDPGVLTWLADKAWVVVGALVGIVYKTNEKKHEETRQFAANALAAHREQDEKFFNALHEEQHVQRGHIAKLFDRFDENAREADSRHRELMQRMHEGQQQLLNMLHAGLSSKADK